MTKLKRTVLYSTAVVALGLGAVVAIYSDAQNTIANIEPAAGTMESTDKALEQTSYQSDINAAAAMDSAVENVDDVLAEIEDMMNAVATAGENIADNTAEMIINIEPAAGHGHGDDNHGDEHSAAESMDSIQPAAGNDTEHGDDHR